MRPAAAADLRARGERQRRRRHTATAVAAAAVVVVVGIAAGLLGGGPGSPSEPAPAPAPSATPSPTATIPAATVAIPAGFPLAAGYPDANEDLTPVEVTVQPAVAGIDLCGEPVLTTTGAVDVAGATCTGIDDFRGRTLLLFACPTYQGGRFTPVEVRLGDEPLGFDQRSARGVDLGLTVYQVIQVGPAVLIDVAPGEANGSAETRASFADHVAQEAAEVVHAMAALTP